MFTAPPPKAKHELATATPEPASDTSPASPPPAVALKTETPPTPAAAKACKTSPPSKASPADPLVPASTPPNKKAKMTSPSQPTPANPTMFAADAAKAPADSAKAAADSAKAAADPAKATTSAAKAAPLLVPAVSANTKNVENQKQLLKSIGEMFVQGDEAVCVTHVSAVVALSIFVDHPHPVPTYPISPFIFLVALYVVGLLNISRLCACLSVCLYVFGSSLSPSLCNMFFCFLLVRLASFPRATSSARTSTRASKGMLLTHFLLLPRWVHVQVVVQLVGDFPQSSEKAGVGLLGLLFIMLSLTAPRFHLQHGSGSFREGRRTFQRRSRPCGIKQLPAIAKLQKQLCSTSGSRRVRATRGSLFLQPAHAKTM